MELVLQFVPVLIIGSIIYLFIRNLSSIKKISNGRSFEDYKEKYPDCFTDGKISCFNCGSQNIFLQKIGHTPTSVLNSHICKQCGSELYRSKAKLI